MKNESRWPLHKYRDNLRDKLRRECPEVFKAEKHLDAGTDEWAFYHYGYMMALNDILHLASGPTGKARLVAELTETPAVTEEST